MRQTESGVSLKYVTLFSYSDRVSSWGVIHDK